MPRRGYGIIMMILKQYIFLGAREWPGDEANIPTQVIGDATERESTKIVLLITLLFS